MVRVEPRDRRTFLPRGPSFSIAAGASHFFARHSTRGRVGLQTPTTRTMPTQIKVPCSSANIGPGFDVIGLALNLYLELEVSVTKKERSEHSLNCKITYEGVGAEDVPLVAEDNLITRTAVYVLRCHGIRAFPSETHVHVKNPIPLGRGLGSSAAAIVAGVHLANEVGNLKLSKARMLDYCLMEERHPDNVAAALYGGFVGTYLNELSPRTRSALRFLSARFCLSLPVVSTQASDRPSPPQHWTLHQVPLVVRHQVHLHHPAVRGLDSKGPRRAPRVVLAQGRYLQHAEAGSPHHCPRTVTARP